MRWVILTFVLLACIGAAFAQNAPADGRFVAQWEPRQDNKFIREYPREALDPGLAGAVELCCAPRTDRTIACRIAFEWPTGHGFGEAALRISEGSRMTQASYDAYRSTRGAWMQIPIRFRVSGARPDIEQAFERISRETEGLCRPGAPVS